MRPRLLLPLVLLVLAAVVTAACQAKSDDSAGTQGTGGNATDADGPAAAAAASSARTIVTGLHVPWGIAFLPGKNGDALVAERTTGKIIRVSRPGGHKSVAMTGAGRGHPRR